MTTQVSPTDRTNRLLKQESRIQGSVFEAARAISIILDEELYLETHDSFERVLPRTSWGFTSQSQAYQLVKNCKNLRTSVRTIVDRPTSAKTLVSSHLKRNIAKAPENDQAQLVACCFGTMCIGRNKTGSHRLCQGSEVIAGSSSATESNSDNARIGNHFTIVDHRTLERKRTFLNLNLQP